MAYSALAPPSTPKLVLQKMRHFLPQKYTIYVVHVNKNSFKKRIRAPNRWKGFGSGPDLCEEEEVGPIRVLRTRLVVPSSKARSPIRSVLAPFIAMPFVPFVASSTPPMCKNASVALTLPFSSRL